MPRPPDPHLCRRPGADSDALVGKEPPSCLVPHEGQATQGPRTGRKSSVLSSLADGPLSAEAWAAPPRTSAHAPHTRRPSTSPAPRPGPAVSPFTPMLSYPVSLGPRGSLSAFEQVSVVSGEPTSPTHPRGRAVPSPQCCLCPSPGGTVLLAVRAALAFRGPPGSHLLPGMGGGLQSLAAR